MDSISPEITPERTKLINQIGRPFAFSVFSVKTALELQLIREQIYIQVRQEVAADDIRLINEVTDEVIIRCQQGIIPLKPKQNAALNFFYVKKKTPAYICRHLNIDRTQLDEFIKECPEPVFYRYLNAITNKEYPTYA